MATLTHASQEWRTRPAHERFYDVQDLVQPLTDEFRNLRIVKAPQSQIEIDTLNDEIMLSLPAVAERVQLNHWSFDQLAKQLDVSARDLRRYPAALVTPILQHQLMHSSGVSKLDEEDDITSPEMDGDIQALFGSAATQAADDQSRELQFLIGPHKDGGLVAKSVFAGSYGSYSPLKLVRDALIACEQGWRTPRAWKTGVNPFPPGHPQARRLATADDVMVCSIIKEGDEIDPAGVYRGQNNIFIFLADPNKEVLPNLYRFLTIEDGEDRKLRATFGLMNYSCGNHTLWGCMNVHSVEKKHRKGSIAQFRDEFAESLELVNKSNTIPEGLYHAAKTKVLGASKDAVSDEVFGFAKKKQLLALTRRVVDASLVEAEYHPEDLDGASPWSVWGVVQGLTRYSQSVTRNGRHYADQRQAIDRAAGALLDACVVESDAPVSASIAATVIEGGVIVTDSTPALPAPDKPANKRGRKS